MRRFFWGFLIGLTALPGAGLILAWRGLLPVNATANPPRWEEGIAGMAFDASVARHAPHVANPTGGGEREILAGMKLYLNDCAGCHGDSRGASRFGAGFYPRTPQFSVETSMMPDWQMYWIVKNGVRYSGMPAWAGEMSDTETWQIVIFLSHLHALPATVQAEWRKPK